VNTSVQSFRARSVASSTSPRRRLDAGTQLRSNDRDAFVVHRGLVLVRVLDERDESAYVQLRRGPTHVGLERLAGLEFEFELLALTNAEVQRLPWADFDRTCEELTNEGRRFVRLLGDALAACVRDRVAMSGPATLRVARLLVSEEEIPFNRAPRRVWAEVLGMRPETLSRALHELGDAGLVTVERDRVKLVDRESIERLVASSDHGLLPH